MATPFYFDSDAEAIRVLNREGKRLEKIAKKVWRQYLGSYKPKKYATHITGSVGRTNRSLDSIELKPVKRLDANTWYIEVTFKNDLTYHPSVFGGKEGHSIMLISRGWKVKKGRHKNIHRFGYYEGFDYIGKVVAEFNSGKHKGVELEVQWSGKYTR